MKTNILPAIKLIITHSNIQILKNETLVLKAS